MVVSLETKQFDHIVAISVSISFFFFVQMFKVIAKVERIRVKCLKENVIMM